MKNLKNIFAQELFIGFVSKVTVEGVNVHVPSSDRISRFLHLGDDYHGGLINNYVVIEGEKCGFVGRVISTEIPEKERLEISETAISSKTLHPLIKLEIQTIFDFYDFNFTKSISGFPNVGAKVYHARKEVVDAFVKRLDVSYKEGMKNTKGFATLLNDTNVEINVTLQSLFSRHIAIVGTTGGGKSWTTAKLIENIVENGNKVIILDPTGEYKPIVDKLVKQQKAKYALLCQTHIIPYKKLTVEDLFFLTEPADKTQKPKLFEAIRSLKLVQSKERELRGCRENYLEELNGIKLLKKENKSKEGLASLFMANYSEVNSKSLDFDINALALQVERECIWDNGDSYGKKDENSLGHCVTLIGRISNLLMSERFDAVFDFHSRNQRENIFEVIDTFNGGCENLLCIDLSSLPYQFNIREIVVNIIGERLLDAARSGSFTNTPIVVMLDEAHQFLNKRLDSDFTSFSLDAFDNIAKEGRKYGLFLGITTQIPRDIPVGTLSQIGTFIVHRLINHRDKETITNALSSANREILGYLPDLGAGEAILSSVELKMPLLIKVNGPDSEPASATPGF